MAAFPFGFDQPVEAGQGFVGGCAKAPVALPQPFGRDFGPPESGFNSCEHVGHVLSALNFTHHGFAPTDQESFLQILDVGR
jgi:hypothetical protein